MTAYRDGDTDPVLEQRLLAQFPALPTAELAARDFAAFSVAQRELVVELLKARRLMNRISSKEYELYRI